MRLLKKAIYLLSTDLKYSAIYPLAVSMRFQNYYFSVNNLERIDNFQDALEEQGEKYANEIAEIRNEFSEKNLLQDNAITNLNDTTASISQTTIKLQTDVQTNKDGIKINLEELSDLQTKLEEHGKNHTRDSGNRIALLIAH